MQGKQTVADMSNESRPPVLRMQNLERLDGAGAYKVAVENGLHEVIIKLCRDDAENLLDRFRNGTMYDKTSYVHFITATLWRGQRNSRGAAGSLSYGQCDGGRIKGFVKSSPEAFPAFWEACLATVRVPLDSAISRDPRLHGECHQMARDVLASLSQIFTNDGVSKAILRGPKTSDKDARKAFGSERIDYLALTTNSIIKELDSAPEGRDLRMVLEGYIYQNSAMIAYRAREHNIDEDYASKLKMTMENEAMYKSIALPLGEGTIKKGYALTNEESQVLIHEAAAQRKQEKKAAKGKKGKGKKGRGKK